MNKSSEGFTKFGRDVPAWIKDWVLWAKSYLAPEWDIKVKVVDTPDPHNSSVDAKTSISPEYMAATIVFDRELKDNTESHIIVCHEVAHTFLSRLGVAQRMAIDAGDAAYKQIRGVTDYEVPPKHYEPVMSLVDEAYDNAEEETVVKLSRILVALRGMEKT